MKLARLQSYIWLYGSNTRVRVQYRCRNDGVWLSTRTSVRLQVCEYIAQSITLLPKFNVVQHKWQTWIVGMPSITTSKVTVSAVSRHCLLPHNKLYGLSIGAFFKFSHWLTPQQLLNTIHIFLFRIWSCLYIVYIRKLRIMANHCPVCQKRT